MRAFVAVSDNEDQIAALSTKLTNHLAELDILSARLRAAAGDTDSEEVIENYSRINRNKNRVFSYMLMRVQATEKIVYKQINIVQDTGRQPGANTVLSKVLGYLQLLDEVRHILNKDVDIVSNHLVTADLTETQAKELSDRINGCRYS